MNRKDPVFIPSVVGIAASLLAVGLGTLLVIITATIWLGDRVQSHFNDVISARDTRGAAIEMRSALQTAESSQRGFLVGGNEIYLAPYDRAKTIALRQLAVLERTLTPHPESRPLLRRLSQVVSDKINDMDLSIELKKQLREKDALSAFQSNRGKALMDEANIYLSGVIRASDARLTASAAEQRTNATLLRWVSISGAFVIILVVTTAIITIGRVTREIAKARDGVRYLNKHLEERVAERTSDLARARDRAEALLAEVNHRVANSLALVLSLVRLQSRVVADVSTKNALAEMDARVSAVAAVHRHLYTSGNVERVDLDEYMSGILDSLASIMRDEGLQSELIYEIEPIKLRTDASVNLGVIATEWVTNAFKYAYPGTRGRVLVHLRRLVDDQAELLVEDAGVGRADRGSSKGTGFGTRIVHAMAESINGQVQYRDRSPGTAARLIFPLGA